MKEFKINRYITLKLVGERTELYVNGESFIHCKSLILSIPKEQLDKYELLDSIDEAAEVFDHYIDDHMVYAKERMPIVQNDESLSLLSPEEEFWGHCSNLQVWAENDYDTRLIKSNLAFPLLKELAESGDSRAEVRLKEEIIARIQSGYEPVIEYLKWEGYIDMLNNEELLNGLLNHEKAEVLLELQKQLDIEFQYVPNIHWEIYFPPPIDTEKLDKIRKFSISDKKISLLNLEYNEFINTFEIVSKLKNLEEIQLNGSTSGVNADELINPLNHLKNIKKIYVNTGRIGKILRNYYESEKKINVL